MLRDASGEERKVTTYEPDNLRRVSFTYPRYNGDVIWLRYTPKAVSHYENNSTAT